MPTSDYNSAIPLWHGGAILSPDSPFSREIFKLIRPGVPHQSWPVAQPLIGLFMPIPSGMALVAEFEYLTGPAKKYAEQAILSKGVALVKESPAAYQANLMFKAKRWRDICMFALLPLIFAIPIVDGLFEPADHAVMLIAAADFIGLIAAQLNLGRAQDALVESRFIAHIPTPSMKIRLNP